MVQFSENSTREGGGSLKNTAQLTRRANKRLILRPAKLRWRCYFREYIKEYNYRARHV